MKHGIRIFAAAALFALAGSVWAGDKEDDPDLRQATAKFEQERRHLIEANLQLTGDEAARFWPLYDRFQKNLDALTERRRAIIAEFGENYDDMSEATAKKIMFERIQLSAERFHLMKEYYPQFERALPVKKLARYYQIESKIYFSVEAGIAEELPLLK